MNDLIPVSDPLPTLSRLSCPIPFACPDPDGPRCPPTTDSRIGLPTHRCVTRSSPHRCRSRESRTENDRPRVLGHVGPTQTLHAAIQMQHGWCLLPSAATRARRTGRRVNARGHLGATRILSNPAPFPKQFFSCGQREHGDHLLRWSIRVGGSNLTSRRLPPRARSRARSGIPNGSGRGEARRPASQVGRTSGGSLPRDRSRSERIDSVPTA